MYGLRRLGKLLIDSGSSINLIKENILHPKHPIKNCNKEFYMGNDKHLSTRSTTFKYLNKEHLFYIVPENFPIPEDGIIGVPFLYNYKFSLSNSNLMLNNFNHDLIDNGIFIPKSSVKVVNIETSRKNGHVIIEQSPYLPTSVYKISEGQIRIPIANHSNETVMIPTNEIKYNYIKINDFKEKIQHISTEEYRKRIKLLQENCRLSHMEQDHRTPIEKIILHYHDVFTLPGDPLPCTNLASHKIVIKEEKVINNRSYKPPECHRQEINNQVKDMYVKGIIKNSDSPYNSPLWVVPKKVDASGQKKWRIVVDFRKLNEMTDQDAYPLPVIDDILDHLGKAKFFSAFDLSSGFHQISMDENSKKYTAFSTSEGHFEYERMPFGLKNAPATFQRMMDTALKGLIGKICFVYLDDIVVFGSTMEQHNQNIVILFERLRKTGLKLQPDKCEFLRPELEYLGHVITKDGVKPNPKKLEAVMNFKRPSNVTEVKSFLGLAGYYRKFIQNFSSKAKQLTELTKDKTTFYWTSECEKSFKILKNELCSSPVLRYPDYKKEFTLTTDASNKGLGAVLSQEGHPCYYISRTLNKAEENYNTTEKELLAIVWAVKRLRQYLLGHKFKIQTDHQALTWLFNVKDPSSRLLRWRLKLEEYDYTIEYCKGKENLTILKPNAERKLWIKLYKSQNKIPPHLMPRDYILLPPFDEIKWLTLLNEASENCNNRKLTRVRLHAIDPLITPIEKIKLKILIHFLGNERPEQQYLFCENAIGEITNEEKEEIIRECHGITAAQHFGENKSIQRARELATWSNMEQDVIDYVKKCGICQRQKLTRIRPRAEAIIPDTPLEPNEKIAMDIFGPLPITLRHHEYILSIQDQLTKYLILIPMKDTTSESIITELFDHYIYIFSSPKHVLTDQGSNFVSELISNFENLFKIKHIKTSTFHPQSNGSLERAHGVVKDLIKTAMEENHNDWDENLKLITMGYNTSVHEGTGYTPFELTFGRKANIPSILATTPSLKYSELIDLWRERHETYIRKAKQRIEKQKQKYKETQDKRIVIPQTIFDIGDMILIHNNRKKSKLDVEWVGPATIVEIGNNNNYIVLLNNERMQVHANQVKPFYY